MSKIIECQAKDPSTCRYHGLKIAMEAAVKNQDFEAYYEARKKTRNHQTGKSSRDG